MSATLALPTPVYDVLVAAAQEREEVAFVGEVKPVVADGRTTFILRQIVPVPAEDYVERSSNHLVIRSTGFMPAMGAVARANSAISFIHTHPGGGHQHSDLDDRVDEQLSAVAALRTGGRPYVSIVVVGGDAPYLVARVFDESGSVLPISRVRVAGSEFRIQSVTPPGHDEVFDRQVRAFGRRGQELLRSLRIGVVGVGGTGSAVVEQLTRLGVGELVVVDDDVVEQSNIARIYGSSVADVGRAKVDVVADGVDRIGLGTKVQPIQGNVTVESVARRLRSCDVIFGCTDDQAGRGVLARLAYWYLIPTLDLGVVVTSSEGAVREIVGRITYLAPGEPCLLCRRRITPEAIAEEALSTEERERLAREGYVVGLQEPAPSVVTLTSLVAATATTDLLHRLFHFTPATGSELLLRVDHREIRTTTVEPVEGHFCVDPSQWGLGDTEPFLGQLWVQRS